jgi:hypothetical protein
MTIGSGAPKTGWGAAPKTLVRSGLSAGGGWIRTSVPRRERNESRSETGTVTERQKSVSKR